MAVNGASPSLAQAHASDVEPCMLPLLDGSSESTGQFIETQISLAQYKQLLEHYKSDPATLYSFINTAWSLLLRCFVGQERIAFYANYGDEAYEPRGIRVVHLDFHEEHTIRQCISNAAKQTLSGKQLSSAPWLGSKPKSSSPEAPTINTTVHYKYTEDWYDGDAGAALPLDNNASFPEQELWLICHITRDNLRLTLWSSSFDVSKEYVDSIAAALQRVFTYLVESPSLPLKDIDYVSDSHIRQMLEWQPTPAASVMECVHDQIYNQVMLTPEKEAVCAWDRSMSYRELWSHARPLAAYLVTLGIGADDVVPIMFEKSSWVIVAVVAIMEAGAGFCPMEPAQPNSRLQALVKKLGAQVILCSPEHLEKLSPIASKVVAVDAKTVQQLSSPASQRLNRAKPNNICYVMWTSGSTGEPKGITIEHHAYCSSVKAQVQYTSLDSNSRILNFSSFAFDVVIIEMLSPLMIGGTVCVPSNHERINDLATMVNRSRANWSLLTPTVAGFLSPSLVPTLKVLHLGGEAMNKTHMDTWSSISINNIYGPAECTPVTYVNRELLVHKDVSLLGWGMGAYSWLVDPQDHNKLMPPGCVAELVIEGPTVGRGYINDPKRTQDAYIVSPKWATVSAGQERRMYKSGDLVRYHTTNGMLHFVGRKDNQVKLHGQRIEMGEIEHHLDEDANVDRCIVIMPRSGRCMQRLVAILSLESMSDPSLAPDPTQIRLLGKQEQDKARPMIEQIRQRLSGLLPAYMMPSVFLVSHTMPKMISGKLDRRKMAQWLQDISQEDFARWAQDQNQLATVEDDRPATERESQIRAIWSHVLNLQTSQISLKQSFLNLGGDSISAMMVQSRCKKEGIGVSVNDILRSKSLTQLACLARGANRVAKYEETMEEDFDLSPIQTLFVSRPNWRDGYLNQSFFVRLTKPVRDSVLRRAIKTVMQRHSMLRARFRLTDDEWKQRITSDVAGSHRYNSHHIASEADALPTITKSQQSIDLVNGPIFSADLFNVEGADQLLFLTCDHRLIDLVSWRVVMQDIEEILLNPTAKIEPQPSLPYQAWLKLQVEHAHRTPLNSVLPTNDIPPPDFAYWGMDDKPNLYGDIAVQSFELDVENTAIATSTCHRTLRTETLDVLLAVLIHSFAQTFTDRLLPMFNNETHGREAWDDSIDLSRTVGWFTAMYPVFVANSDKGDFFDTLRRVKDYRRAVPANGRPYFASRWLTTKGAKKFANHWPMEITLNYLGVYQQLERQDSLMVPIGEVGGEYTEAGGRADYGHGLPRYALFEISAVVIAGQLRVIFSWNKRMDHIDKIKLWVSNCQKTLQHKPANLAKLSPQPTLSDFPLLSLTYESLTELITKRLPKIGVKDVSEIEDIYRCSQMQQGLLISIGRDAETYTTAGTYTVRSNTNEKVDLERLASAWQQVIDRHSSMRTVFIESNSSNSALYDQVVLKSIRADIVRLECETADDVSSIFRRQQPMKQNIHKPLHRLTFVETRDGQIFFKWEIHHVISDGTSLPLIFGEMVAFYEGSLSETAAPPYSNYISFLQNSPADAGIGYWKSYLDDAQATKFPILHDNEPGARELRQIGLDLDEAGLTELQDFCKIHGVTLANVFYTAWALTLQYYTHSSDVCYGYMMSTRDATIPDVDKIAGYLVNMLVCRVVFEPGTSLVSVMQQLQTELSDGQTHRHTALSEVLHATGHSGDSLFNSSISYNKMSLPSAVEQHEITLNEFERYYDPTEYNVGINIEVGQDRAKVDFDYWSDCLSDGHAANVANTFRQAIRTIIEHSDKYVDSLNTITQADQTQIMSWNSKMPPSIDRCVHDVFSEQVQLQPDASAVCGWDASYTYRELDIIGTKLASFLNLFGVGPESYVCLAFEKSSYTIVAMLGVLKAGGAYVSLDPMHPITQLQARTEDVKAQVVLTSSCYAKLFAGSSLHVIAIDEVFLNGLKTPLKEPSTIAGPHNPFCIIFTSGSTGKPKGVVIEHRAMVTSAEAHGSALGFTKKTRCLQFASYTFDNNNEEIFTTLMRGGTVCVPSEHDRMNDLAGVVTRMQANFIDLTPTVATYLDPEKMKSIKSMSLGGEALTKSVLEVWGDKVDIYNQYGPSECTINSTCRPGVKRDSDTSSIGRAIGCVSWIVDANDHDKIVPIGCEGELLLEGPILARGYLNDLDKTSKAFIENPTWAMEQNLRSGDQNRRRRMYKTGDLVRYQANGEIAYMGRKDQQVKLHGQRIELGEIEYHVKSNMPHGWHFGVELIIPGNSGPSQKCLAVFVCPQQDDKATATTPESNLLPVTTLLQAQFKDLEAALAKALPKHMIPSMFIPLANLPLSSAGKLDRKALQAVARSLSENQAAMFRLAGSGGRKPITELEKTLAELWESTLKLKPASLGMDAQFFRVGGDSIAAIRLVTAARSKGITLTVADIFRNASLEELCKTAKVADEGKSQALKPGPRPFEMLPATTPREVVIEEMASACHVDHTRIQDIYPCNSLQEGLIAISTKQPGAYVYQSIYHLKDVDCDRFRAAWQAVVTSENILRTRIVWTNAHGFLQIVLDEEMDWSERQSLAEVTEGEKVKPAYNGGPLSSYIIIKNQDRSATFIWTVHHALYDGWSFALILQKVQDHYLGLKAGSGAKEQLYPKFIQHISSVDSAESANFWKSRLIESTSQQYPSLPQPTYQPSSTSHFDCTVPLTVRPSQEITVSSMIRAAWAFTISAYSNSNDVVFAETITGRDVPVDGIVDMVGPTLATVPVRATIKPEQLASDYLKQVQTDFTECMTFQHMGLQQIKRINQDTARACDFQNLIAINNDAPDPNQDFWGNKDSEDVATDFFTYALTVAFDVSSSEVKVSTHYDPQCISEWQLRRVLRYFEAVFSRLSAADAASSTLGHLGIIHDADVATISQWNGKTVEHIDRSIHDVILDQANTLPRSAPAICAWDLELTYQELDRLTTALAGKLVSSGVRHHDCVPICFEKSGIAAVAMLAVLKAGASFVALDGQSPKIRLQGIVADVEAKAIVCSPPFAELSTSLSAVPIVLQSQDLAKLSSYGPNLPLSTSTDIAYIIFTSGSTGKPKGTMVSHAAFVSGASAHAPAMGMLSSSRVLQFASYTFDASIMEIFSTLLIGGCVCVPDDKTRLNDVASAINKLNANWALLTPSFAQLLSPVAVPSMKTLVMGGEAMTKSALSTWADHVHLVNAYGPSECAVVATVNEHVTPASSPSNIGRAVGGQCFIVNQDNHNKLIPIGAIGELVVTGPILAQGYLKEPEKTAQAFVASPNWLQQFAKCNVPTSKTIYKTGDLVRYAEDGSLIYLGRKDNQTKLHGQRLELGEIEYHLTQSAAVQHGLTILPKKGFYSKRLVAVISPKEVHGKVIKHEGLKVVSRDEATPHIKQLRDHLTRRVPPYMVPSNWIVVEKIPLLPSGKLDRRHVSQWIEDVDEKVYREIFGCDDDQGESQGTDLEAKLQNIWSKVLGISTEQIGLSKNFLYLGGDSISALQVASRCRGEGIGVTVQDIMRSHSISHLASTATVARKTNYEAEKFDQAFKLSPMQQLFFRWAGQEINHFNQSSVMNMNQHFTPEDVAIAITSLIQSHSMLRARFEERADGQWVQKLDKEVSATHRFTFHAGKFTTDQIATQIATSQGSLDIRRGPIFAVDLYEADSSHRQVLSLVLHHLVVDVVSWGIIIEDLEDLLQSKVARTKPSLPFQTWCSLQEDHASAATTLGISTETPVSAADLTYWGIEESQNLYSGSREINFDVEEKTTKNLLGPCREALGSEMVDTLLATILSSFCRTFSDRQKPPAVFNEAHGRESWDSSLDLAHTIGWFTTISPVTVPPEAAREQDITNIIRWVKDYRSRIVENGRQYFASRMLTDKGERATAGHWPLEIAFNYLGHEKQFKKTGSLLSVSDELTAKSDIASTMPRFALFELSASIVDEKLKVSLSYNKKMNRQPKIQAWAQQMKLDIIQASERLMTLKPQITLCNFGLLPLHYDTLSKLQERLTKIGASSLNDIEDVYGCSPMQQGVLMSQLKNVEQYMYHVIFSVTPKNKDARLDTAKFEAAWNMVVQRHSALRTVFVEGVSPDSPMDQVILKRAVPTIKRLPSDSGQAVEFLQRLPGIKFTDAQPHHRMTLMESNEGITYCKLEISHAISDGTSVPIIFQELAGLYDAPHVKIERTTLHRDYIAHVIKTPRADHLSYWRTYLEHIEPCIFPSLNDGKKVERQLSTFELKLGATKTLQAFCADHGVTLSNLMQLAWALLLRTYTGNDAVCFGYLSSGRDAPVQGIEGAVGLFISMLVCRMDLAHDMTTGDALKQVANDYMQSSAHQAFSLGDMQHELQLGGRALFNTAFTYQRRSMAKSPEVGSLQLDLLEAVDPSEYPLTVNIEAHEDNTDVLLNYWTDIVSDDHIKNIADTYAQILRSMMASTSASQRLEDIEFCSPEQQSKILAWNRYPLPKVDKCVHDVIIEQADSLPGSAPAVTAIDIEFSYNRLLSVSKRLARHLAALGAGPNTYIPICFEKSAWSVVAIMAILQSGAAFVPLEPSHPDSRIKFIMDDVKARIVLTSQKYSEKFSEFEDVITFVVDKDVLKTKRNLVEHEPLVPTTADAAYLIFTSGTTGLPKGTIISHHAFATSATEHGRAIRMKQGSRILQFSNLCFDASVMEILTGLVNGGCVCIPTDEERMNNIPGAFNRMSVDWTLLTPSVANMLTPDSVPTLKTLVTGGEAMQAKHIERWAGKTALINAYGPSECAVITNVSMKIDENGRLLNGDCATIGGGVGCKAWVVDARDHTKLMPVGSVGELVIEGNTVSRGYLNNGEKTKKAFVPRAKWMICDPNEIANGHSQLIYKTGDLVRCNSDGTVSYVSRKDTQIKLNGLRIELGEIEHHVKQNLPEHIQASVEMVAPAGHQSTLAVFFVNSETATLATKPTGVSSDSALLGMTAEDTTICSRVKKSVGKTLPGYMVPSLFVPLKFLPTTASGKMDRQRLSRIIYSMSKEDTAPYKLAALANRKVPTDPTEKKLAMMWETLLRLDAKTVSRDDNFFVIGGDSVLAMRLVAAARREQMTLTVLDIFQKPTLMEMARACGTVQQEESLDLKPFSLIPAAQNRDQLIDEAVAHCQVSKDQIQDTYPCSPLQEGLIALSIKQAGAYVAHNVFKLPRNVDIARFKAAWEQTVKEMDIMRTRVVHANMSSFIQVLLRHDKLDWQEASSVNQVTDTALRLPEHNGSRLMRFTLVEGLRDQYFVWSIHHALYDGWSMPKVIQKVEDSYFGSKQAAPAVSYSRFIKYLASADTQASESFWRKKFEGMSALHFPKNTDMSDDDARAGTLTHSFHFNKRAASSGITFPILIKAAWAMILAAHTGNDDVLFGETLSGRDIPVDGIMDIIGPTLTTVPNRVEIDHEMSISDYVQRIRDNAAQVIPHQHVGLQNIRKLHQDALAACDFQNLLVIQMADEADEDTQKLLDSQDAGDMSNFFTYPLVVECKVNGMKMEIDAHFHELIIEKWHVERIVNQFECVLQQLYTDAESSEKTLKDIRIISTDDLQILQNWNDYKWNTVSECAHELFLKQAELCPYSTAVCAWDGEFSYKELQDEALYLAKYLKAFGVSAETYVPFCLDKSRWHLVAELAIMMADGAFVPLDPAHPASRHSDICKDVHASIMICTRKYEQQCKALVKHVVVLGDGPLPDLKSLPPFTGVRTKATSRNAAYIIYTSGSTGKPKGVVIEHEAFCTSSQAFSRALLMTSSSRILNFASVTFDATILENLTPLTQGSCVCVPSDEEKLSDLAGAITRLRASWAFLTPSVANLLDPEAVPTLKILTCGGEAMSEENVLKWADKVTLVNGYGPTEAAVITVTNANVSRQKDPSNIGYVHHNGKGWISKSDNPNQLAPLGCEGELLLEGPILAREYLHDREKTAKAFVRDPPWSVETSTTPGVSRRFYRTGDLAKYKPDGSINYLGRFDRQVKLHGQRIELGEIEHKFELHDHIRHAVCILTKKGLCQRRLVVVFCMADLPTKADDSPMEPCVMLHDEDQVKDAEEQLKSVKEYLNEQLPSFMMPALWAAWESVPLLSSGKLDKKQVERWVENMDDETYSRIAAKQDDQMFVGELSPLAQQLREIWAAVFVISVEQIDPGKSFMSQGGDSLVSMSIVARCRKVGISLTVQDILQAKSLVQLARVLESRGATVKARVPSAQQEKENELFDLSPVQQLYFKLMDKRSSQSSNARFNQSQFMKLKRKTATDTLNSAIETLVRQHSMFRARFSLVKSSKGSQWKQQVVPSITDSFIFREHQVRNLKDTIGIEAGSQECLNIEQGPLFVVDLFETTNGDQYLSLIAHHLVIDVVSWGIIIRQLEDILTFQTETIDKPLPFQVWCAMQRENANQRPESDVKRLLPFKVEKADIDYWGMHKCHNTYSQVKQDFFQLDKQTTHTIMGKANKAFRTQPVEIMLCALFQSFQEIFTTRKSATIFNESHGRDTWDAAVDLSETVGWFTSIFPLTIPTEANDKVTDVLKYVKDLKRSVPNSGRDYFAHRFLTPDGGWRFGDHEDMEILFNYLGQNRQNDSSDSIFGPARVAKTEEEEKLTSDVGPDMPRLALFEISAGVNNDQLKVSFMYNRYMKHQDDIMAWITKCERILKDLAKQLVELRSEPTLADLPLLPTTYGGLNKHISHTLQEVGISNIDEVEDVFVTAPMQEGLLLSQLKDPSSYHNDVVAEVKLGDTASRINVARLGRAWQKVIDRHQSLRTVFVNSVCTGHAFDQIALKHAKGGAKLVHCEESQYSREFGKVSLRDVNKKRKPKLPHQLTICTTTNNKCFVKLELNHAVIDGGSVSIIIRDLALAYENRLPEAPKPLYSDYIKYLSGRSISDDVSFWQACMKGLKSCHLPKMDPSGMQSNNLEQVDLEFDQFAELQKFCRANELTLSNVMLAVWGLVLAHYTSREDVCFGNLTSGRDAPVEGITDTVGAFINMLVCRVNFSAGQTLNELFKKVQKQYLESLPHQHYPLAKLQHDLGLGKEPLFNTAVSIQNQVSSGNAEKEGDALSIELVSGHDPTEYAVTLNISTVPGNECARVKYWTNHVSPREGKNIVAKYAEILGAVITHSEKPVSHLVTINQSAMNGIHKHNDATKTGVKSSEVELGPDISFSKQPNSNITSFQPEMYRSLVKDCVREVIEQIFTSGQMMQYMANPAQVTAVVSDKLETLQPTAEQPAIKQEPEATAKQSEPRRPSAPPKPEPPSHMVQSLRSLWAPLLQVQESGISNDDSFFLLGGDSLLAMELASAAREAGLSLTVADIFGTPVLGDMAQLVHDAAQAKPATFVGSPASALIEKTIMAQNSGDQSTGRFALLEAANAEAFIQDYICPKIGVFRGGIVDVLPVTDFQALAVTGSLVESKWMLNHVIIEGMGYVDLDRLKKSAYKVVQHFDILRTVFLPCGDRFLQVILRNLKPQVNMYETDEDLASFTQKLREGVSDVQPRMGESYVQFSIVKKAGTLAHRIVIRLSHAQYDGVCMPRIIEALKTAYEGKPLTPSPGFVTYVKEATSAANADHYDYWKGLLRGSSMTPIVHRTQPSYGISSEPASGVIKRQISLASLASKNITPATILKAAWAYVLAQISGLPDIVFGNLISGRNVPLDNVESIVGPCVNMIPIRIKFSRDWTALDLLKRVQNQAVSSMPFESLGFREIIQHCTSWPEWTFFSSIVQHNQSVQTSPTFKLDRTKYKVAFAGAQDNLSDISIVSCPLKEENMVEIAMTYVDDGAISPHFINKAMDMMCTAATSFASEPSSPLPALGATPALDTKPLPSAPDRPSNDERQTSGNVAAMLRGVKQAEVFQLADTLTRAWRMVLPRSNNKTGAPAVVSIDSNFYELGGDLISLASLTSFLEGEGYEVRLEDLTNRPSMGEMIAFLSLRRHAKEGEEEAGVSSSSTLGPAGSGGEENNLNALGKTASSSLGAKLVGGKKASQNGEGRPAAPKLAKRESWMARGAKRFSMRKSKTAG